MRWLRLTYLLFAVALASAETSPSADTRIFTTDELRTATIELAGGAIENWDELPPHDQQRMESVCAPYACTMGTYPRAALIAELNDLLSLTKRHGAPLPLMIQYAQRALEAGRLTDAQLLATIRLTRIVNTNIATAISESESDSADASPTD